MSEVTRARVDEIRAQKDRLIWPNRLEGMQLLEYIDQQRRRIIELEYDVIDRESDIADLRAEISSNSEFLATVIEERNTAERVLANLQADYDSALRRADRLETEKADALYHARREIARQADALDRVRKLPAMFREAGDYAAAYQVELALKDQPALPEFEPIPYEVVPSE